MRRILLIAVLMLAKPLHSQTEEVKKKNEEVVKLMRNIGQESGNTFSIADGQFTVDGRYLIGTGKPKVRSSLYDAALRYSAGYPNSNIKFVATYKQDSIKKTEKKTRLFSHSVSINPAISNLDLVNFLSCDSTSVKLGSEIVYNANSEPVFKFKIDESKIPNSYQVVKVTFSEPVTVRYNVNYDYYLIKDDETISGSFQTKEVYFIVKKGLAGLFGDGLAASRKYQRLLKKI